MSHNQLKENFKSDLINITRYEFATFADSNCAEKLSLAD
jgi:hypothetical protein